MSSDKLYEEDIKADSYFLNYLLASAIKDLKTQRYTALWFDLQCIKKEILSLEEKKGV